MSIGERTSRTDGPLYRGQFDVVVSGDIDANTDTLHSSLEAQEDRMLHKAVCTVADPQSAYLLRTWLTQNADDSSRIPGADDSRASRVAHVAQGGNGDQAGSDGDTVFQFTFPAPIRWTAGQELHHFFHSNSAEDGNHQWWVYYTEDEDPRSGGL